MPHTPAPSPTAPATQTPSDVIARLFEAGQPNGIGILTLLMVLLYILIQRYKEPLTKLGGAGALLVKGGFSLWVESKLLGETSKRIAALETENKALKDENIRLAGYIEGVKTTTVDHDERIRDVEHTKIKHSEQIYGLRTDLDRTALSIQVIHQNMGDISVNMARLAAHRDADLLINAELAEDIREIRNALLNRNHHPNP